MSDIHTRIKELRQKLNLSMEALAAIVGVSWQTIQQWEKTDGTAPKRERLQKVADALKTTKTYLLDGIGPVNPTQPSVAEPDATYQVRRHHARKLVGKLCDLAEQVDDHGLRGLIEVAQCFTKTHPFTKAKLKSSA
jgi:transcriptional regulator with XRE-family HTH domain